MALIETWLPCELTNPVQVYHLKGNVFSQDSLGNLVGVDVTKDGEPVTLSGSVTGYCILSDGSTVPVSGVRSGNKASITLLQACYAVPGVISIVLKLTDGDTITTLACVVATVYQSKTDNMVTPSSTVIEDWAQQIADTLQECIDATTGTVKYSETQSLTSTQKSRARNNIGAVDETIINGTVKYSESQSLTTSQKAQARTNIGAAGSGDIPTDYVSYGSQQSLTDAQKTQARSNIGAIGSGDIPTDYVSYGQQQSLTDAQKTQARSNIGAADSTIVIGTVKYNESQSLTDSEKTQARTNIGAGSSAGEANFNKLGLYVDSSGYVCQTLASET